MPPELFWSLNIQQTYGIVGSVTIAEQWHRECTITGVEAIKALESQRELDYALSHAWIELLVYTGFHVVSACMVESIRTKS